MFESLRSRLWLSYALVISVALGIVSIVLLVYLARNPMIYRQEAARLLAIQNLLLRSQDKLTGGNRDQLNRYINQLGDSFDARVIIFDPKRELLVDSDGDGSSAIRMPRLPRLRTTSVLFDGAGDPWMYLLHQMDNEDWLMVAARRPAIVWSNLLRDDLVLPIAGAAIAAFLLSLLLAYMISRWVGDPLQQVISASKEMPKGEVHTLRVEGPREIQELIHGFNKMSSRIKAAQESQRQFVADVSHELKTPLTIIQGFAQAILDDTADSPDAKKLAARKIFEESGRMHGLVLGLLDLARIDAGSLVLKHESVDMSQLIRYVVERFLSKAEQAGVHLESHAADMPNIYGDKDRLAQVFSNLLDNAIKFTPQGGSVTLSASNDHSQLRIAISDSGPGIPQDALPHVFDRFYQADPSRPRGEKHGAGLGLAIVREIVHAHHGTITAQSTLGQGSSFVVTLPLALPDASTINRRREK